MRERNGWSRWAALGVQVGTVSSPAPRYRRRFFFGSRRGGGLEGFGFDVPGGSVRVGKNLFLNHPRGNPRGNPLGGWLFRLGWVLRRGHF